MNDRILIMRQAISVIAQTLTGSNIKVTQSGLEAYVRTDKSGKAELVNLPYLPDNADETLIDAVQGFLDHEVGKVLFSDMAAIKSAGGSNKALQNLMAIIEDARIEKAMVEKYRGSRSNLDNVSDFFLENIVEPRLDEVKAKGGSQEEMVGALMTPILRDLCGQDHFTHFMKDKQTLVQDFYDKVKDLAPALQSVKSTSDVINIARTVLKRIQDDEPPTPPNPDDSDEEGDEEGGMGGGKGKGKGAPSEEEGSGSGEGESDDDSEDEASPEPESEPEEGKGKPKEPAKPKEPGEEKGKGGSGKMSKEQPKDEVSNLDCGAILDALDKDSANNFDASVIRKMGEQVAAAAKGSEYVQFTNEGDVVETLKIGSGFDDLMTKKMIDKVDHMVGPMQKDLERAMVARSRSSWENGTKAGRLHGSALSRLVTGDTRVFRKRHDSNSKDVAVSLVIDASGSMSGAKLHTASMAAYALSSVLDRLRINHEVICFTTGQLPKGVSESDIQAQAKKHGIRFARTESLYMPVIKHFSERMNTETKRRFAWLPNSGFLRNNVDGESISIAAQRLMGQKQAGKMMIVFSDGCPAASGSTSVLARHLKDTIKEIEAAKIKVVGIGIESEEVKNFYSRYIILNDVKDLPNQVIKELRSLLLAP